MSQKNKKIKIVFTGGGSGGHIFPILAVMREIKKILPNQSNHIFYYIGPKDHFSSMALSGEGIKIKKTLGGKIRRYFSLWNFVDIFFRIPISLVQSFFYIFIISPDLVFSKGGYGSMPITFWSWIFQIPILLHESDIDMGLANRITSHWATEIFTSFPQTRFEKQRIFTGNPIRTSLLEGNKENSRKNLGLFSNQPAILILGGSQGAQKINDVVSVILEDLLEDFEIIHHCGQKDFKTIKKNIPIIIKNPDLRKRYHLYPILREWELKHAYHAADLVIGRAGAGVIFEIAALGKASILIPLKFSARDHQIKNAYDFAKDRRSVVIEENNFFPHFFLKTIQHLFSSPIELENMRQQAKDFSRPKAAFVIANYIINYLSFKK